MQVLLLSSGLGAVPKYLAPGARIGFIATAAEPYENSTFNEENREDLRRLGFAIEEVDVSGEAPTSLQQTIADVDAIFMAGGNTFYLLQKLREKGVDRMVVDHVAKEKLYIGSSAGSVLVGPSIEPVRVFDDPDEAPDLVNFDGLGLVDYVVLPHYGNDADRPLYEEIERSYGNRLTFVKLRDDEAIFARSRIDREIIESA
jgi:dipeptidase E